MTGGRHVPNSWADVAAVLGAEPAARSSDLQASTQRSAGAKGLGFPPQGKTERVYFTMRSWLIVMSQ